LDIWIFGYSPIHGSEDSQLYQNYHYPLRNLVYMKKQYTEKEKLEWYNQFKKGDLVRANIDFRNSNLYRIIHPNVHKVRV